jgi:hypothetical protein
MTVLPSATPVAGTVAAIVVPLDSLPLMSMFFTNAGAAAASRGSASSSIANAASERSRLERVLVCIVSSIAEVKNVGSRRGVDRDGAAQRVSRAAQANIL